MQQIPESVKNKLIKVSSSVFELLKRSKQQLTSSLKTQNDTIHTTVKEHKDEIST